MKAIYFLIDPQWTWYTYNFVAICGRQVSATHKTKTCLRLGFRLLRLGIDLNHCGILKLRSACLSPPDGGDYDRAGFDGVGEPWAAD